MPLLRMLLLYVCEAWRKLPGEIDWSSHERAEGECQLQQRARSHADNNPNKQPTATKLQASVRAMATLHPWGI